MTAKEIRKYFCSNCGAPALVRRGDYNFVESGLDYVILNNIELIHCDMCGNEDPIIRRSKRLMQQLLIGVASKPEPLEGQDLRFIRKQLGLTQEKFGALIHTDKTTVSKWENDADPIGPQSDLLIRSVAISLGDVPKEIGREIVEGFKDIAATHTMQRLSVDAENDYRIQPTQAA
jgi:putative zinc finger/helix-turn-helix YgiT family protein